MILWMLVVGCHHDDGTKSPNWEECRGGACVTDEDCGGEVYLCLSGTCEVRCESDAACDDTLRSLGCSEWTWICIESEIDDPTSDTAKDPTYCWPYGPRGQ